MNPRPLPQHEPLDQMYTVKERVLSLASAAGHLAAMHMTRVTVQLAHYFDGRQEVRQLGPGLPGNHKDTVAGE